MSLFPVYSLVIEDAFAHSPFSLIICNRRSVAFVVMSSLMIAVVESLFHVSPLHIKHTPVYKRKCATTNHFFIAKIIFSEPLYLNAASCSGLTGEEISDHLFCRADSTPPTIHRSISDSIRHELELNIKMCRVPFAVKIVFSVSIFLALSLSYCKPDQPSDK